MTYKNPYVIVTTLFVKELVIDYDYPSVIPTYSKSLNETKTPSFDDNMLDPENDQTFRIRSPMDVSL